MANIRVDLDSPIYHGQNLTFKSPADCSQVTGLIVYYPEGETTTSKTFQFADAHGNNVGDIDNLFAENVLVKVILDTDALKAFVQNADTNAYLESRFHNKNLLHNWYFADPVNQRGKTEYTSIGTEYTIDRWMNGTPWGTVKMSVYLEDDGVNLIGTILPSAPNAYSYFKQVIANTTLVGKTLTFSALVEEVSPDSEGLYPSLIADSNPYSQVATTQIKSKGLVTLSFKATETFNQVGFGIPAGETSPASIKVSAAKLELGSQQTLARQDENGDWVLNDPPPDKNMELLKCIQSTVGSSDTFANKTIATGHVCNENLLHNWYFGNPVDQRGGYVVPSGKSYYNGSGVAVGTLAAYTAVSKINTTTTNDFNQIVLDGTTYYVKKHDCVRGYPSTGYTIDRWYNVNGTTAVTIESDGIKLSSVTGQYNCFLRQTISSDTVKQLAGKTVVISALMGDKVGTFAVHIYINGEWYDNFNVYANTLSSKKITIPSDATSMRVELAKDSTDSAEIKFKAVKLELGTEQTLAHLENGNWVLNEIPDKGEELIKCIQSTADSADKYANKVIATGYNSNPNLLDNWYFANPVDQRDGYVVPPGVSSYHDKALSIPFGNTTGYRVVTEVSDTYASFISADGTTGYVPASAAVRGYVGTANTYMIDRWLCSSGTLFALISSTGLKVGSQSGWVNFVQRLSPYNDLLGRTFTASILTATGKLFTGTGVVADGSSFDVAITNGFLRCSYASSYGGLNFQICANSGQVLEQIVAAKFELGTEQTLAHKDANGNWVLNEVPKYAEELAKCQRYFYRLKYRETGSVTSWRVNTGICTGYTQIPFTIELPVPMRANPSVSWSSPEHFWAEDPSTLEKYYPKTLLAWAQDTNYSKAQIFLHNMSNISAGKIYIIGASYNAYFDFNADL